MPLLEPRRRSFAHNSLIDSIFSSADRIDDLIPIIFDFSLGRYWALFWSLSHLSGFILGSFWALGSMGIEMVILSRIACFFPIFLGVIPRKWTPILWVLIFIFSLASGSQESFQRNNRKSVSAPSDWEPSAEVTFPGTGIFRPTAWAKTGQDSFWQSPAVLLAWKPKNMDASNEEGPQVGHSFMISGQGIPPAPSEIIGASILATVPTESTLQGIFDYRRYLQGRGITWKARCEKPELLPNTKELIPSFFRVLGKIRQIILSAIDEGIPAPESNLMMAVLLGERTAAAREAAQPFSRLGLSHLFAVSGLHVGIIIGIILLPLGYFQLNPGWRLLPAILFLPFYVLLTGAPGSVVRAAGMTILLLMAFPLGRRSHSLQLLGLLFWAGIIWQPTQVLDPGLRLSYLATGGIITTISMINKAESSFWKSKWGKAGMGLVVSLAAQWFTFPQVATSFGYVSGFSPLANLFTVPLFGMAVWSLVLGLSLELVIPAFGQSLLAWTWIIVRFLTGLLNHINPMVQGLNLTFPLPSLVDGFAWVMVTTLMLIIIRMWSRSKASGLKVLPILGLLGAMILFLFQYGGLGNKTSQDIHVLQLAVGQGDCSIIVFPDGWCGFIDTAGVSGWGASSGKTVIERKVLPWLKRQHVKSIGAIVLTHGHLDHTGGTTKLLQEFKVDTVLTGGRSWQSVTKAFPQTKTANPTPGETLHIWRDWEMYFVQPDTHLTAKLHENDQSLVVVLKKSDTIKMVWTGDMEKHEETILLNTPLMPAKTGVLKAGHHGSNTSSSQPFLNVLAPQLVLISCGVDNQYHHPSHGPYIVRGDTLPILRTDLCGSIHLKWDPQGNLTYKAGKRKGFLANP